MWAYFLALKIYIKNSNLTAVLGYMTSSSLSFEVATVLHCAKCHNLNLTKPSYTLVCISIVKLQIMLWVRHYLLYMWKKPQSVKQYFVSLQV